MDETTTAAVSLNHKINEEITTTKEQSCWGQRLNKILVVCDKNVTNCSRKDPDSLALKMDKLLP